MSSFVTPSNGDDADAELFDQITEALSGLRNIPIAITGINDGTNYALSLRNAGTGGRGLQVLDSSGATLLLVQDSGVTLPSDTTLTSPHFTTAVVDSGGLQVTAGNIGIGVAPNNSYGILSAPTALTGTSQYGVLSQPVATSAATSAGIGMWTQVQTAAVAFTMTNAYGLEVAAPNKGAGSTITSAYGILIDAQNQGGTDNFGIFINAPSGGSGNNLGLVARGSVALGNAGVTTTATVGYPYIPLVSGTPTGTPSNGTHVSNMAPMVLDTTGSGKLWFYVGGGWHYVALT